ncbi:MAG TPA: hypothetical protein VEZ11_05735 [Thermoanaerobaculia bacterium]|nr:hypothetical protein [Thermoanaerobaculia bacterium]
MNSRKPWEEKLKPEQQPHLVEDSRGRGLMLVPTPLIVAAEIRRVARGRLITPEALRDRLAKRYGAAFTCPMTTGIFLSIIAGAAEDQLARGSRPVAPYWRVVQTSGVLNPKWPPGPDRQASHLRAEGHRLERATRGWRIAGRE